MNSKLTEEGINDSRPVPLCPCGRYGPNGTTRFNSAIKGYYILEQKLVAVKRYSENRIRTGNPKILQINPSVMGNMLKMGRHELAARARRQERAGSFFRSKGNLPEERHGCAGARP